MACAARMRRSSVSSSAVDDRTPSAHSPTRNVLAASHSMSSSGSMHERHVLTGAGVRGSRTGGAVGSGTRGLPDPNRLDQPLRAEDLEQLAYVGRHHTGFGVEALRETLREVVCG